jgi:hypothetical protein
MKATFEDFLYGSGLFVITRKKITTALLFIFYARSTPKYFKNDVVRGQARCRGIR